MNYMGANRMKSRLGQDFRRDIYVCGPHNLAFKSGEYKHKIRYTNFLTEPQYKTLFKLYQHKKQYRNKYEKIKFVLSLFRIKSINRK